jgi:hypothetical protein
MRTITLIANAIACAALVGCGSKSKPPTPPVEAMPAEAPPPVSFEMTSNGTVEASVVLPDALTNLEWPAAVIVRSVAAQRRRFASAGPDARQREAADLATALWYSEPSDSDAERTAREESRKILRDVVAGSGATETVLWMLTVAERALGDADASAKVYDELILRFPQSPRAWRYRAVRAWLELRKQDHARAAEIVNGADLAAQATPSAIHYVAGWIALRRAQPTEGHALLVTAMQRWSDLWSWDAIRHEGFGLAALAGAKPDYMLQIAGEIVNGPPKREAGTTNKRIRTVVRGGKRTTVTEETTIKYEKEWLGLELGRAYAMWGRFDDATTVLERSRGGDPATDAAIERELMLLAAAANAPGRVAAHAETAKAAYDRAMTSSGAGDVRELNAALLKDVARLAAEYAAFAGATGIEEYRTASDTLGRISGTSNAGGDATTADQYRASVLDAQIGWSMPRLRACYATPLQSQTSFAGTVTFQLVPGANGRATLSQLSPPAGNEGLGAVAGCVSQVAATWRMTPARGANATTATIELGFKTP